jgi:hypothetical protein
MCVAFGIVNAAFWSECSALDCVFCSHSLSSHDGHLQQHQQSLSRQFTFSIAHMANTHFVGRESSCFVGADDICAAKRLDTREVPDDRILLSHFFGSFLSHEVHEHGVIQALGTHLVPDRR